MKKIYWRPRAVSRTALLLIAIIAIAGLFVVERFKVERTRKYYTEKMEAAREASRAMEVIKDARLRVGPPIDPSVDPSESGLIGLPMSSITSVSGDVLAKQTSVNPNFAAVILEMLKEAGVKEGDVVAVGISGSFPALNISAYAALETLKARPVVITSVSASQWGANVPELPWLDMERILREAAIFNIKSVAASVGGYEDRGLGLSKEGLEVIHAAIERNEVPLIDIDTTNEVEDFEENVQTRMEIYRDHAEGKPIKAYINIGGGTISVGRSLGKRLFHAGLNFKPPGRIQELDGIMPTLISQGVPVIHMIRVAHLAELHGLPVAQPNVAFAMPEAGDGNVFQGVDYNRSLVIATLTLILLCLYGFIRSDVGFRLLRMPSKKRGDTRPEPMV